jgi:hypothetical protein
MVVLLTNVAPMLAQGEMQTKPSWVLCGSTPTEVPYTLGEWRAMTDYERSLTCKLAVKETQFQREGQVMVDAAKRQMLSDPTRKPFNKGLGIAGAVTALAGVALLLPHGKTVHVLGDDFCVTDYSVDAGGCGPSMSMAKWGAIFLGSGIALGWLGWHEVDVKPLTAPGVKGATATVKWGGKGK